MIKIIVDTEVASACHNSLVAECGAKHVTVETLDIKRHGWIWCFIDKVNFWLRFQEVEEALSTFFEILLVGLAALL